MMDKLIFKGAQKALISPHRGYDTEFLTRLSLLELFFRTVHFFEWPSGFISQGIVDKNTFDGITRKIKKELEENEQKAREKETNIIKVARNLGLHPEPTGDSPSSWRARCPGMNHPLFMDTKENIFFCGWCKRKGTAEDLILLVEERNKSRK